MDKILWNKLNEHVGHKVEIVTYGNSKSVFNVAIECEDCGTVILDYNNPDIENLDA